MDTILFTAPYMIPFVDRFRPVFEHYGLDLLIPEVNERMEAADLLHYAGQFDGTICGDDRYTAAVLQACVPRLKIISKWGTGIDSIDQQACQRLGIRIGRTINAFTNPVADSVLGYLLAYVRRLPWMDHSMKAGVWDKIPGKTLGECSLGVVGVGRIGQAVLRRASAFGMTLLGTDIVEVDPHFVTEYRIQILPLEELLARSDFVSLNCDLNPTSYHLMNAQTLALMKPNAVLINTARGPVVEEPALVSALQRRQIAGAALDVFEHEPLPFDSPLRQMEQVMLAPHNANSSPAAWERVHWNTIRNLLAGLEIDPAGLDAFRERIGSNR
ncbi:MAG: phosphoglycerate dehydrogenase [Anaerolineales bacterium]|nr:phosphoglycerate dehydrogenase [Anaerolineales bacterium]